MMAYDGSRRALWGTGEADRRAVRPTACPELHLALQLRETMRGADRVMIPSAGGLGR